MGGNNRKKLTENAGTADAADEIIIRAEAADSENTVPETGHVIMEPPKRVGLKLMVILSLISVAVLIILGVIFLGGKDESCSLDMSPAVLGDTVVYHVNENTAGNGKLVRKNFATGEEMASLRYDSLSGYVIFKNKVYYIESETLWRSDLSFEKPELIMENVKAAVLYGNDIYYISSKNANQLRRCSINGKNDTQLSLVSAPQGVGANYMTVFNNEIYIRFGNEYLAKLGMDAGYQETVLDNAHITNISPYRDSLYIFTRTEALIISGGNTERLSFVSEYAVVEKNSVYYMYSPDGGSIELYKASSDLKKRELLFTFPDTPYVDAKSLAADRDYAFIELEFTRDSGRRSVLYLLDLKESQASELYSIGYYTVAE